MAGSETIYTARLVGPEILEAGRDNVITCPVYNAGSLVAPSAGTLTVWNASNVKVLDAVAVTTPGSIATYTVATASLTGQQFSDGWRFEWALTISAKVYTFRRDGSLVYRRLYPVVTDADLLRAHTDLTTRRPASESSYQDYLDEAWAQVESKLVSMGRRPWLILSPSALRDVHMLSTLVLIFRDFATGGTGSAEWEMMLHYEAKLATAWGEMTYPEATPSTGEDALGGQRKAGAPSVWLCASASHAARWPT